MFTSALRSSKSSRSDTLPHRGASDLAGPGQDLGMAASFSVLPSGDREHPASPLSSIALPRALQRKATLSAPEDPSEREADRVADRVLHAAEAGPIGSAPPTIQRKCASCQEEEKPAIQAKSEAGFPGGASLQTATALRAAESPGSPLSPEVRGFFEPRFSHDFSKVRVHADGEAASAARGIRARAYTTGSHIVFGSGEFSPHSREGRRLLAHELTHVIQQDGQAGHIHRTLKVDAAASDDKTTAIPQMTALLNKLSPDFDVDAKSGQVTAKAGTPCAKGDFGKVAGGAKKVGNCCLCTLARAPAAWKIIVTIKGAPTTSSNGVVKMTPTAGPTAPDLRSWSAAAPTESVVSLPPEEALGHELCGHAALMQAGAHPPDEDENTARTFSDIHDPTVKTENALAGEMGLAGPRRGLAAGGAHRGESLRVFAIQPFAADDGALSVAADAAVDAAAAFADGNPRQLIDIVGFRDAGDKKSSVSQTRADTVRTALDAKMKNKTDVGFHLSKGDPDTAIPRLQPASDGGAGPKAMVEVRLAREPAGLLNLPAGVALPAKPDHVGPKTQAVVDTVMKPGAKGTGNACHDLLIKTAWT